MTSREGKEAIALFTVIIVILAALTVGVVLKDVNNKGDNPNGILGMYEIVDYTQYGTEYDGVDYWEWYTPDDKVYDGEKISIDSYKDGIITGTCYLDGNEFSLVGYYDPETYAFGYGSAYNYTPEGDEVANDLVHGYIINNTMYLRGLTVSPDVDSFVMYSFNFTFVKEGERAQLVKFDQVIGDDDTFGTKNAYMSYIEGNKPASLDISCNVTLTCAQYMNGVYDLNFVYDDSIDESVKATATTVYQDSNRTFIRGVMKNGPEYDSFWLCVEGDQLYMVESIYDNDENMFSKLTSYMTTGNQPKKWKDPYNLDGRVMDTSVLVYSSATDKFTDMEFVSMFDKRLDNTFITPMFSNEKWTMMTILPNIDCVGFNTITRFGDGYLYSDMFGYIQNGEIITYGFAFKDNGDVVASRGIHY